MDLPAGGHTTRSVIFNRAGTKMYVAVGSQSNNNAGEDCRRAAILELNPDGSGYRVFASGIRSPVGLAAGVGRWLERDLEGQREEVATLPLFCSSSQALSGAK
jgi:hypothetical protein